MRLLMCHFVEVIYEVINVSIWTVKDRPEQVTRTRYNFNRLRVL